MSREMQGAAEVLGLYGLAGASLAPLGNGLINLTWLVTPPRAAPVVLQRVATLFPPEINGDICVVTQALQAAGVTAPQLLPAEDGRFWVRHGGYTWRLMSWLPGDCHDSLETEAQAESAGRLLGRFHTALIDLEHRFANPRLGVHDTARHLASLRQALTEHDKHPRIASVRPLAEEILARSAELPELAAGPDRIVHGDPKINNMLFDSASGEAFALIDLDTVGLMPVALEIGDALRSWCNPAGEDGRSGEFSVALFAAALQGYVPAAESWLSVEEMTAFVPATETIILELAARFCADALNESYFGWDPARFASRSEHNEVRAAGQLSLARSFAEKRAQLSGIVQACIAQNLARD